MRRMAICRSKTKQTTTTTKPATQQHCRELLSRGAVHILLFFTKATVPLLSLSSRSRIRWSRILSGLVSLSLSPCGSHQRRAQRRWHQGPRLSSPGGRLQQQRRRSSRLAPTISPPMAKSPAYPRCVRRPALRTVAQRTLLLTGEF